MDYFLLHHRTHTAYYYCCFSHA